MKSANRAIGPVAVSLCLVLTAGCSLIDPYVAGDSSAYREKPTLNNAVAYAETTRDAYRRAIRLQTGFNTLTGVALVGTATAAAILGVTGASPESIVRLGISGAGLFAVDRLLFNSPRQQIYAAGAKAITCGLGVFEPLRTIDSTELDQLLVELPQELQDLRTILAEALNLFPQRRPDAVFIAQNVLGAAEATLERGRDVQRNLRDAGGRLYTFVHGVNDQVTSGLIRTEPDLSQLINSLGTTIPINAALIAGLPPPGAEPPGIKPSLATDAEARAVQRLEEQTARVKAIADAIEGLIIGIASPDPAAIAACNDFLQVRPFRVFPQPSVVVDTSAAEATADVVVSGGMVPYRYAWLGQTPSPGVTLTEVPGQVGATQLVIRIKAPQNTSGTYQLLVEDGAGNTAALLVSFIPGAATAAPTAETQPKPEADPKIVQIQEALVDLACLAPNTVAGDSNTDGVWGDRTAAAYAQFAQDFLGGTAAAGDTLGTFGSPTFYDNLIAALDDAKGGTKRCTTAAGST